MPVNVWKWSNRPLLPPSSLDDAFLIEHVRVPESAQMIVLEKTWGRGALRDYISMDVAVSSKTPWSKLGQSACALQAIRSHILSLFSPKPFCMIIALVRLFTL